MSFPHGTDLGGVRTLERLKERCFINPATGCWEWRLATNEDGTARVWIRHPDGSRQTMRGRKAALLLSGAEIPPGKRVITRACCGTLCCVNPDHARVATAREAGLRQIQTGASRSPAKVAAAMDLALERRLLTPAQVAEIHATTGVVPATELARRWGVSTRCIRDARHGRSYRELHPDSIPRSPEAEPHSHEQPEAPIVQRWIHLGVRKAPPVTNAPASVWELGKRK